MRSVCKLQRTVQRQLTSIMNTLVCFSSLEYLKGCFNCEYKAWRIQVTDLGIHVIAQKVKKKIVQFYSNVHFKKTKQASIKSDQLSSSHPYWRTLKASIFYPLRWRNQVTAATPHGQEDSGVFQMCCATFVSAVVVSRGK